ncbi:MAG: Class peptide chain release factor [Gemmatimonadetes bacterium]|nr:Class peptide chain release factor [Gemmatimonadota bacterium]
MDDAVEITESVRIPRSELTYRASRSGGPGGQHVNTSSTRIELTWSVAASPSLSDDQRARVLERLGGRVDGEGTLHLAASDFRSQLRNREAVTERFAELLRAALHVPRARRATRPTRASREQRLHAKRMQSAKKRDRGRPGSDD